MTGSGQATRSGERYAATYHFVAIWPSTAQAGPSFADTAFPEAAVPSGHATGLPPRVRRNSEIWTPELPNAGTPCGAGREAVGVKRTRLAVTCSDAAKRTVPHCAWTPLFRSVAPERSHVAVPA